MHIQAFRHKFLNRALRILLITNSLILVAGAMLGPIVALFVEQIGGDILDAGYAGAAFALAAGITVVISGKYSDRVKHTEHIVVIGYLLVAIGYTLYVFVNSIWLLLLVQLIIGFGEAIYAPAFDSLYSKHLTSHKEGTQWGIWESMNYFSIAGGALIGGIIAHYLGFNVLFLVMAVLSLLSALYIYFLPKNVV